MDSVFNIENPMMDFSSLRLNIQDEESPSNTIENHGYHENETCQSAEDGISFSRFEDHRSEQNFVS